LELPVTCAVNCRVAEGANFTEVGEIVMVTAATTVTDELADLVVSATEVAVIEKNAGFGGTAGAVYRPDELMVPQVSAAQPVPAMDQVTAVFDDPVTVAVNRFEEPTPICADVGEIETPTAVPEPMVTVADPDFAGLESSVAVTATIGGFGIAAGAV